MFTPVSAVKILKGGGMKGRASAILGALAIIELLVSHAMAQRSHLPAPPTPECIGSAATAGPICYIFEIVYLDQKQLLTIQQWSQANEIAFTQITSRLRKKNLRKKKLRRSRAVAECSDTGLGGPVCYKLNGFFVKMDQLETIHQWDANNRKYIAAPKR
jgi:hypothetical protein